MRASWKRWPRRLLRRLRPQGPERVLGVELVNVCNLRCRYCFRAEEMLYGPASFFPRERLAGIVDALRREWPRFHLSFTGGEVALHPEFGAIADDLRARKVRYRFVTNGWHFDRLLEPLLRTRECLGDIVFSLDGATREDHDSWRGKGSYDRLMHALTACQEHRLPFQANVVLRKDTWPQMEALSLLSARLGARAVNFGALLPTSEHDHRELCLTPAEERQARREAGELSRVLRIQVRIALGLHDATPGAHCFPLSGQSANVDYRGRLTLCGNLSSFRGGDGEGDVIGDLREQGFRDAFARLGGLARRTLEHRDAALRDCAARGEAPGAFLGSPCLSCLQGFGKLPWAGHVAAEALPPAAGAPQETSA